MEISRLDVKSLTVFATVMRTNSLSVAAEQLGLSQPAVSQTIDRLRAHFNDSLFVRTGRGTRPTARAIELLEPIEDVLKIIREKVDTQGLFDPSTARRVFTFISSDFGTAALLPRLTAELRRTAPGIRVRSILANAQTMKAQLESGEADLAVGEFSELISGFHRRGVQLVKYVCVAGAHFPNMGDRITRAQFQAASHAVVAAQTAGDKAVEQLMHAQVSPSRILVEVPSFLGLLMVLAESDLLCVVPRPIGTKLAAIAGLAVYPVPYPIKGHEISQYWHDRVHNDPAHRWFRGLVTPTYRP